MGISQMPGFLFNGWEFDRIYLILLTFFSKYIENFDFFYEIYVKYALMNTNIYYVIYLLKKGFLFLAL